MNCKATWIIGFILNKWFSHLDKNCVNTEKHIINLNRIRGPGKLCLIKPEDSGREENEAVICWEWKETGQIVSQKVHIKTNHGFSPKIHNNLKNIFRTKSCICGELRRWSMIVKILSRFEIIRMSCLWKENLFFII